MSNQRSAVLAEIAELEDECRNKCRCNCCGDCSLQEQLHRLRTGQGSIIRGGGVSRPAHMDNDEWGEYHMSAEYAHEVSYVGFDEPYDEDGY